MFQHKSVLLHETIDSLLVKPDGIYVDGTLGGGGHAEELLSRLGPEGRLIGIDQDEDAVAAAGGRKKGSYNKTPDFWTSCPEVEDFPDGVYDRVMEKRNGDGKHGEKNIYHG